MSSSQHVLEVIQLQRLITDVSRQFYSSNPSKEGFTEGDILRLYQLEKYMDAIKRAKSVLGTVLMEERWEDTRCLLDGQIKILEGLLLEMRQKYAQYKMKLQNEDQARKSKDSKLQLPPLPRITSTISVETPQTVPSVPASLQQDTLRQRLVKPVPTSTKDHQGTKEDRESAHRKEHDKLAADLVILAQNLKRNNLAFQERLKIDRNVLKESELLLNTNAGKFGREHEKLKQFRASSWKSTKMIIVLMFLLFISFVTIYLFIKVSRK